MKTKITNQKETYFKCNKCDDEIYWNTHKELIYCKCGSIAVDGCEYYVRIIGNNEDCIKIEK